MRNIPRKNSVFCSNVIKPQEHVISDIIFKIFFSCLVKNFLQCKKFQESTDPVIQNLQSFQAKQTTNRQSRFSIFLRQLKLFCAFDSVFRLYKSHETGQKS